MIASEKGGRGAEKHSGRSAVYTVEAAMQRLLELGGVVADARRCTVGGCTLHYLEAGAGEPLVLLHGAGGGSANWYRMIRPLAERFRVIAVDLPGFGLSDTIDPQAPLGRQIATLVHRLLSEIDVTPRHIAGTSFGGLVAARLAQQTDPQSLVLIDSAGLWPDASFQLKIACNPFFQRLALKQTRGGARWALHHVMTHRSLAPEDEEALIDYIYTTAARVDMRIMGRAYAAFGGWRGQSEVLTSEELQGLAKRSLIIWGGEDRFLPASPRRCAAALAAGAELRIIPGVGHSPNWEAPDELLRMMMTFWNGNRVDEQEKHS